MRIEERTYTEQYLVPDWVRTPELYMPARRKAAEMTVAQLKRGLCFKSGGNWQVCQNCPQRCGIGEQLVQYMTGEATPPETEVGAKPLRECPPEKPQPMPEKLSSKHKFCEKKRLEIIREVIKLVESGETFIDASRACGYCPSTVREIMKQHNIKPPKSPKTFERRDQGLKESNRVRLQKAIEKYIAVVEAVEGGMDKNKAARAQGYKRWDACRNFGSKHRAEIEAARAERRKNAATE